MRQNRFFFCIGSGGKVTFGDAQIHRKAIVYGSHYSMPIKDHFKSTRSSEVQAGKLVVIILLSSHCFFI